MNLTEADAARAARLFDLEGIEPLGGFENALFRSVSGGQVVRLTHTSRRSTRMIDAEFEFMEHLADHGVPVVAPVRSVDGLLAEEMETDEGHTVVAACMTGAPGAHRRAADWSPAEIETYGSTLGAMHAAARSFEPVGAGRRPPWTDPIFDVGLGGGGDTPDDLVRRNREILAAASEHAAGGTGLLIHQDAHGGNLFMTDDGAITVFDFDDSAYGTPTHDVAIVLFYWLIGRDLDLAAETRSFLSHFLRGYGRHSELPSDWPVGADLFLSYREIDIFWLIEMEPEEDSSPGELRFMEGRRRRILEGVPYLGTPLADVLE